jgi:hypothetical protein
MTSLDLATRPAGPHSSTEATAGAARRRTPNPLIAVALTAFLGGGALGAGSAIAVPALTADRTAEYARWQDFAEQLRAAIKWDERWQLMHPERS